jgi:hypothetical protein
MKGHPTRVAVRPERYSSFDPTDVIELQKLVLDVVLHPISF